MGFEAVAARIMSVLGHKPQNEAQWHPNFEPNPTPISPWETLKGETQRDQALTELMHESFNPRYIGASGLFPIADTDGRWFSEPNKSEAGDNQSSVWLDPKKWQSTLTEFAELADHFNDERISFLVSGHNVDNGSEFIIVTPVLMGRDGIGRSGDITFGLTNSGRVHVGNVKKGFSDMGYLNPDRVRNIEIEKLKKTLSSW